MAPEAAAVTAEDVETAQAEVGAFRAAGLAPDPLVVRTAQARPATTTDSPRQPVCDLPHYVPRSRTLRRHGGPAHGAGGEQ